MNQKELILSVLEKLKPYRDMADIFARLLNDASCDEKLLEKLSLSLKKALIKTKDKKEHEKLEKASELLQKITSTEHREKDIEDAESLLEQI